jgi:hypothetical protein
MKIKFDHIQGFGKVTDQDFIYSEPYGELEPHENPEHALDTGWIPWEDKWYNIRSVRIDVSAYNPSKSIRRTHKKIRCTKSHKISDYNDLVDMYENYCDIRGFRRSIDIDKIIKNSSCNLRFELDGRTAGWTFMKEFDDSFVSSQFITDYSCGNLSLGRISQHYECLCATNENKKYVYILGGYEQECNYKLSFRGAEWWTGKEWSTDIDLYTNLCERDSNIRIENYEDI